MEWYHQKGDIYLITGVDRHGKRFRKSTDNPYYALGHNVWRGALWLVRLGKRKLLQRYWN